MLGLLFVLISNVLAVVQPVVIRTIIDGVVWNEESYHLLEGSPSVSVLKNYVLQFVLYGCLLLIGLAILRGLFMFLMRQTIIVMSRHIEYDQKNDVYAHYQQMSTAFYKRNFTGDLMNRIAEDVSRVRQYTGPAVMYTMNLIVLFGMCLWGMMRVHPFLALCVLAPMPFLALVIHLINKRIFQRSRHMQDALSDLTSTAQESYAGLRVVKSFVQERQMLRAFKGASEKYRKSAIKLATSEAIYFPSMNFFIGLSMVFTILAGGYFVMQGTATPGNIAEFVIYVNLLLFPMSSIGWVASMIQRAAASQERINEFLQEPTDISSPEPLLAKALQGDIEFKNVTFTYPHTGITALKNFSLHIKKGEHIAVIGKTGSGKSSLTHLLLRMYDVTEGELLLDEVPVKKLSLEQLRSSIAIVPQETYLFSESIEENVKFGATTATENQVEEAIHHAAFDQDLAQLPNGMQSMIGERGVMLSGGQKQRLGIARALLKDAPILVMDESLSAVDMHTEQKIVERLRTVLKNKTTLLITHRLLPSWHFDKIIVLENGRISESGTHQELMGLNGYYAKLYRHQHSQQTA